MRERGRTRRLFGLGARTGGALLKTRLGGQADWGALGEALFPDVDRMRLLSLIPTAAERPESSLSQMVVSPTQEMELTITISSSTQPSDSLVR